MATTTVVRKEEDTRAFAERLLVVAAVVFAVAVLLHNGDHLRRGADATPSDVFVAGASAIVLEVAIVVLALARHRLAPLVAAAGGLALALGYFVVHFLPERSWLSDSFSSAINVSPLSWTAASLELSAALVVGVAGLVALRAAVAGSGAIADGLRHPVSLAMIAGNAVIFGASIFQL